MTTTDMPPPTGPPVTALAPPKSWRIEWRGRSFRESDLTGEHLAVLAVLNGQDDWSQLDMAQVSPTLGPVRLMLMIAAFLVVDAQTDDPGRIAETIDLVRKTPAEALLAALHFD